MRSDCDDDEFVAFYGVDHVERKAPEAKFADAFAKRWTESRFLNEQRDCETNFLLEAVSESRNLLIEVRDLFFEFERCRFEKTNADHFFRD